ncbi:MAG: molybdopterin converting factor subunit 1 [Pseudomonadota bacterium]
MKVQVRFFASIREAAGVDARDVVLPDDADFARLISTLEAELPAPALHALRGENVRLALNQELVRPPFELAEGDEVAFLPPVTGG